MEAIEKQEMPDISHLEDAIRLTEKALSSYADEMLRINLAALYTLKGNHQVVYQDDTESAILNFKKALEIDSGCVVALNRLALLALEKGDMEQVFALSNKIIEISNGRKAGTSSIVLNQAYSHLGYSALKLYESSRDNIYLATAESALENGLREFAGDPILTRALEDLRKVSS